MNKANPTEILDFGADQLPGLNTIIKTGYAWTQFLTGTQPMGSEIMTANEFDSGHGWSPMLKYTLNNLGAGMVMRLPRETLSAAGASPLERFLRLPIISNTLGRVVRVSNRGTKELVDQMKAPTEKDKAAIRFRAYHDAMKWANTGTLPKEAQDTYQFGNMVLASIRDADLWLLPADSARAGYYAQMLGQYQKKAIMETMLSPIDKALIEGDSAQKMRIMEHQRGEGSR
jgi:hypothetical protein